METQEGKSSNVREVKAVITLRSGKEVDQPTSKPKHDEESVAEKEKSEEIKGKRKGKSTKKDDHDSTVDEEPERIVIKEDMMKKHMPPPFPQALHGKKEINNASEIFEVLRQVKRVGCEQENLLDRASECHHTVQVSSEVQRSELSYHLSEYWRTCVEKALLDLGASVNLLPYSVYEQLGLGELKSTSITLFLADRSVKIPRGMIKDVLVRVDKFYYPVDLVVLDTDPVVKGTNYVPIILGRPFLTTSNAIINCRNGVMQLTFGNMTLELNIFHLYKKHIHPEEGEVLTLRPCEPSDSTLPTMLRQATRLLARPAIASSSSFAARARSFSTDLPTAPAEDSTFIDAWKKIIPNIDPPATPLTFMQPRPQTPSSIPSKLTVNFVLPYASELSAKEVSPSEPEPPF
ncbi:ATP synthase subunit delta', mitochondrial [Vitis vinifera]|uniref:ATP synthase subunit delta', mitochondrial n=1 Tax=Vitis vinifera TaxID=29760 RepID=A0A438CAC0_VITVI|nr:ATP synthase subunit delta', mitochondrial [Vitis vinifera]